MAHKHTGRYSVSVIIKDTYTVIRLGGETQQYQILVKMWSNCNSHIAGVKAN